jgi:chromosome segregation ATPase
MLVQKLRGLQLELLLNNLQNEQLKLEVLRWRKQCSLMRLKLASAREKVQLHENNLDLLSQREQRLSGDAASLRGQLASAVQQLTDMTAAKAQAQAESAKFQVGAAVFATLCVLQVPRMVRCTGYDLQRIAGESRPLGIHVLGH